MGSALDGYAAAAAEVSAAEPTTTLLSNVDGRPVASAADAMDKLVAQLTRPVRWDLCMRTIGELGTTAIVEFPPAGTLTGIAKRELRGVATRRQDTRRSGRTDRHLGRRPGQPDRSNLKKKTKEEHAGARQSGKIIAGLAEIIEEVTGIRPSG